MIYIILYFIVYTLLMSTFLIVYISDRIGIFLRRGKMKKDVEIGLAIERILNNEIETINGKVIEKKS